MQQRKQNNRMMQRNKNRHGGRNNNQNRGNQNRGQININQVTNQRDKYLNMAKDAQHGGDRVICEYYLQHADHYQRLINEYNEQQEARRQQYAAEQQEQEGNADETLMNDGDADTGTLDASENSEAEDQEESSAGLVLPPAIMADAGDDEANAAEQR